MYIQLKLFDGNNNRFYTVKVTDFTCVGYKQRQRKINFILINTLIHSLIH